MISYAINGNELTYNYDGFLPISETWNGLTSGTVSRSYNNFWIISLSVNGNAINFAYDNDGLLTQAINLALTRDTASGLLLGSNLGNVQTDRTYNGFSEQYSVTSRYNGTAVYATQFMRDALGRIIK